MKLNVGGLLVYFPYDYIYPEQVIELGRTRIKSGFFGAIFGSQTESLDSEAWRVFFHNLELPDP